MKYKFQNAEEAILFGDQATPAECKKLKKAIVIFEAEYKNLKKQPATLRNFDRRLQLSTWSHYCQVAMHQANFRIVSSC